MTPAELTAAVQAIADAPAAGYPQRRRGMPADVAQRVVAVVVDEMLLRVTPLLEREWAGTKVLATLRSMRQTSKVAPGATKANGTP